MLDTVLKRFEKPDEVRTFEKGKFELVRIRRHDYRPRYISAGMEMVHSCGPHCGRITLQRGARWPGAFRLRDRRHGRRRRSRTQRRPRSSTFRPDLPATIVGWSAMRPTSHCISSAPTTTQINSHQLFRRRGFSSQRLAKRRQAYGKACCFKSRPAWITSSGLPRSRQ